MVFLRRAAHYASIVTPIVIFAACASLAQSQPQQSNQAKSAGSKTEVLIGTEAAPAIVRITKTPKETAEEQTTRQDEATNRHWTIALTTVIALFTGALIIVGWKQRQTYEATLATNKDIERAYVTMSHFPPGLKFTTQPDAPADQLMKHEISIRVRVQNYGNTPARVVFGLIQLIVTNKTELPDEPGYVKALGQATDINLVKGNSFKMFQNHPMGASNGTLLEALEAHDAAGIHVYAIGYVDYIDKFERRHRCGYGRQFTPSIERKVGPLYETDDGGFDEAAFKKRNNLPYIMKAGYNYDIEIDENGQPKKKRKGWRYYTGLGN